MHEHDFRQTVAYLTRTAFRNFRRHMKGCVEPTGTTLQEWYLLRVLPANGSLSQREAARLASALESNAVATLSSLQRRKLVTKQRHVDDRRSSAISLTAAGRALRDRLLVQSQRVNDEALRGFADSEVEALRGMVARVIANLERLGTENREDARSAHQSSPP